MNLRGIFAYGTDYLVIAVALCAGLAAAYGREREAKRRPDRQWWRNRVLIMPLLAIAATAGTDAFSLSKSMAAFTAAMLSLGGYDLLCIIEARWRSRWNAVEQRRGEASTSSSSAPASDEGQST